MGRKLLALSLYTKKISFHVFYYSKILAVLNKTIHNIINLLQI